ncbi:MAG TPA: MFS transporter [Cyclobacteriaceae bacterium]|nr:MFS transporter [Cyclobacteriaceae bacterium]
MEKPDFSKLFSLPVVVAALGYFVDIYDLLLFSIVRIPSLQTLGFEGQELLTKGTLLLEIQMFGLLTGGILWGILGDKKGRLSVLFGSILLYSLANLANGFVTSLPQYAILRFIAGIGLAGELGAGITLVAEILPARMRGYGTTLVASVGMFGAVMAYFTADLFDWRVAYWVGGSLGLLLLIARVSVFESGVFMRLKERKISRGNFMMLFNDPSRFKRFIGCILIGLPIWYVIGILITLSPEFGVALNYADPIVAGKAVMFSYIGLALGDLSSGLLSQWFQSRKKVVLFFILLTFVFIILYFIIPVRTSTSFYFMSVLLGFGVGYWALFVTIAAEQFGTNLRATVATSVPNFIRGTVVPITESFKYLAIYVGIVYSALAIGVITIIIALIALRTISETFARDLNFIEGEDGKV